jgi:hypothetical protein
MVLIVRCAVVGLGCSGLYSGSATAIAAAALVRLHPLFTGLLGGLFGFSSILGSFVSTFRSISVDAVKEHVRWVVLSLIR